MSEQDVREIVADILKGIGRTRWRAARGRTMEFGGPELRDLINLRRSEYALRWVVRRERDQEENALRAEVGRLRDVVEEAEYVREEGVRERDELRAEVKRLRDRLTELEALGAKIKEGEST